MHTSATHTNSCTNFQRSSKVGEEWSEEEEMFAECFRKSSSTLINRHIFEQMGEKVPVSCFHRWGVYAATSQRNRLSLTTGGLCKCNTQ